MGDMVLPEFLDRYLAKRAVAAQQTGVPVPAGLEDNLMGPVHGLHRTRGSFSSGAASRVVAVSGPVARLVPLLAAALAGLTAGLLLRSAITAWLAPPQPHRRALR